MALTLTALISGCAQTGSGPVIVSTDELGEARAATRQGNWQRAASLWNQIFLRNDEMCPEACLETARALLELEEPDSARSVLDFGLARYPENAELLEMHGNALAQLGFSRAAESALQEALELEPDRPQTLLILARLRMDLGLHTGALAALERRLEMGAEDADTFFLAGRAYRATGQYARAYAAFEHAFARREFEPLDLVEAARMITRPRVLRIPDAERLSLDWLQRAVAIDPQLTVGHVVLGRTYELLERPDDACESYRRAVETDPADLEALTSLACLYHELGDSVSASEIATRALEFETDPDQRDALAAIARVEAEEF